MSATVIGPEGNWPVVARYIPARLEGASGVRRRLNSAAAIAVRLHRRARPWGRLPVQRVDLGQFDLVGKDIPQDLAMSGLRRVGLPGGSEAFSDMLDCALTPSDR